MNNQAIRWRVGLAIVGLAGIIFLQGFWLKRAWDIHNKQLGHRIHVALNNAAYKLEKEHLRLFIADVDWSSVGKWEQLGPKLARKGHQAKMEVHNNVVIENINDNGNEIRIEVVQDSDNGEEILERKVIISKDGNEHVRTTRKRHPHKKGHGYHGKVSGVHSMNRWIHYAEELAEESLMSDSILIAHIQTMNIDSVIRTELDKEDIESHFAYAIVYSDNAEDEEVVSSSLNFTPSDRVTASSVPLLHTRSQNTPINLLVNMDQSTDNWPPGLVLMTLLSFLFTGGLVYAFWYTVRSLYNQKRLSDIKTDFINNMTHEFKTPLSTISLAVDSIRHPKIKEDGSLIDHYADIIKEENTRMNDQVERVLHLALLNKGQIPVKKEKVNLHELIKDVARSFDLLLERKEGVLHFELGAANPDILIDQEQFQHTLSNLIDNAIKYSEQKPEITIRTADGDGMLQMQVSDRGMGMDKETLRRVFSRFYRAQTGNIQNVKGFGLGLSYVKSIVDLHDGTIRAESELGKGSTFIIEIPQNG